MNEKIRAYQTIREIEALANDWKQSYRCNTYNLGFRFHTSNIHPENFVKGIR